MQLAFITPTAYLEKYSVQGDFYLALAHLVDSKGENAYTQFHSRESKRGKRVVLDNGLFEGSQVSTSDLLDRAAVIKADVVCAPDALYDSKGTIKAFKQFIRAKQDAGVVAKVMGIPQADNEHDWWDCFHFMQTNPDCDMIGLSILSIPKSFGKNLGKNRITLSRIRLIEQLYSYKEFSGHDLKPMHMLGLGEGYADIMLANRLLPNEIVSNDSSSAFVHGMQGITYDRFGHLINGKDHTKLNFNMAWTNHPAAIDHEVIQQNIHLAKAAAKSTSVFELVERRRNGSRR